MEFNVLRNMHIKEEPIEQVEDIMVMEVVDDTDTSMTMDGDPMNLLEPVAECNRQSEEELQDVSDYNSDYLTRCDDGSFASKWQIWLKKFPWLLHTDESKDYGFCLYCGKNVAVNGITALERHNAALIHNEREKNYKCFENFCRESNENAEIRIKDEFLSNKDSYADELISKRISQSKAFNDFNWSRWLKKHVWLVRQRDDGTKGYCKYCKVEFDVEVSLSRERHEKALKHKLGEKLYLRQPSMDGKDSDGKETETKNTTGKNTSLKNCDTSGESNEASEKSNALKRARCFEKMSQFSTNYRCNICRVVLGKRSVYKHMKTKLHRGNLQLCRRLKSGKKIIARTEAVKKNITFDWSKYAQMHPWIAADPENAKYAYCLYCKKRLMYGLSSVKRYLHENSVLHREAKKNIRDESGKQKLLHKENDHNKSDSESQESVDESSDEVDKKSFKRAGFCTDEWFKIHRYYKKNPDNTDYIYCKCCKVLLLMRNFSAKKHESSERHRIFAMQWEDGKSEGDVAYADLQVRKQRRTNSSWLGYTKSGQNYCKFCRIVLSRKYWPTSHERTERHKLAAQKFLIKKNILKTEASGRENVIKNEKECNDSIQSEEVKWQLAYPWLLYNEEENREHYAFCSYCKNSVFVPTEKFASKHQSTANHIRAGLNLQHQSQSQAEKLSIENEDLGGIANGSESKSKIFEDIQKFPWLSPDPQNDKSYGYCNFCKIRIMIKGVLASTHQNSKNHILAAKSHHKQQEKVETKNENSKCQQSHNNSLYDCNDHSRTEKSSSYSLATRLTNAHTEILSLCRELNENRKRKSTILSTAPFSIAACLSPFDLNNVSQSRLPEKPREIPEPSFTSQERNTYDLFFESMKETVKKLPTDLAAESRVKIMHIVYDLEMRALERTSTPQNNKSTGLSSLREENQSSNTVNVITNVSVNRLKSPNHRTTNAET